MGRLIDLVNEFPDADGPRRADLADEIICTIRPELNLFVFAKARRDRVEDVCQEVLIAIATGLSGFRGRSEKEFWSWCYRIARNKIYDDYRALARDPVGTWEPEALWQAVEAAGQEHGISAEEMALLTDTLDRLKKVKPPCYDYLWSRFFLGWSHAEIARVYGLPSAAAAHMQIHRCLKLAETLGTE